MLIRDLNGSIRELPEEVAELLLSDPSYDDDISDFTSDDVNILIHTLLSVYFEHEKTFEQTVVDIKNNFKDIGPISKEKLNTARVLIKKYNIEIPNEKIGMVDVEDMIQFHDPKDLPFGKTEQKD